MYDGQRVIWYIVLLPTLIIVYVSISVKGNGSVMGQAALMRAISPLIG